MFNLRKQSSSTTYTFLLIIHFQKAKKYGAVILIPLDICPVIPALTFNLGWITFLILKLLEKNRTTVWVIFFSDLWSTELALQGCWTVCSQLLHSARQIPVLLREDIASFSTKKLTFTGENSLSQLLTFYALTLLCTHFTLLSQSK